MEEENGLYEYILQWRNKSQGILAIQENNEIDENIWLRVSAIAECTFLGMYGLKSTTLY